MESDEFRKALGCFATGVAIVTVNAGEDAPVGMTMSSFNSVSLDPPLVLFSVDRRAKSLQAMLAAQGFAINVLGSHQRELSARFSRALSDKWTDVDHSLGHADAPILKDVIAHFECVPYSHHDGGDHVVFLVRVLRVAATSAAPLVFFGGRYRELAEVA